MRQSTEVRLSSPIIVHCSLSPLVCSLEFSSIQSCATGREGEELHYKAGLKTEALNPRVSFIPTIGNQAASAAGDYYLILEIDGSQHSQKEILKHFHKEVCRIYSEKYLKPGQKMPNCL